MFCGQNTVRWNSWDNLHRPAPQAGSRVPSPSILPGLRSPVTLVWAIVMVPRVLQILGQPLGKTRERSSLLTTEVQETQGVSPHQIQCLPEHLLQAALLCLPRGRGRSTHHARSVGGASLTGVCCPQMQQMYDMIMQHKRAMQDMQLLWEKALQQHQHGYDSDEEVDSELGTWEHQLRRMEMDKTRGGPRGSPRVAGQSAGRRPAFRALWAREAHSAAQEVRGGTTLGS